MASRAAKPLREEMKAKKQAYVRDEIAKSAAILFADTGFRAVTIDDIASSLGYTKSVVYYYFKNKNELLWDIFCRIHDAWWEDMAAIVVEEPDPRARLSAMIRKHALNVMERTSWTAIYFRDEGELSEVQQKIETERKKKYDDLFKKAYTDGVAEGTFKDMPPTLVINSVIGMCNWTHGWYKRSGKLTPPQVADHYVTMLMSGCLADDSGANAPPPTAAKNSVSAAA